MKRPRCPGIYAIVNTVNGHRYIGSAVNLQQRWYTHQSVLRRNVSTNHILQNAWNRYGEAAFVFRVLDYVEDKTELLVTEQQYIDSLHPEYNICQTAGNKLGVPLPPEAIEVMRSRLKGQKRSDATRQRQSNSLRGIPKTPQWRQRLSESKQNLSPETRAKMSAAKKGKVIPGLALGPESLRGKERPDDVRAKISATKRAQGIKNPALADRNRDPEHIAKVRAGLKAYHERKRQEREQTQ